MPSRKPIISAAELEALIQDWGSTSDRAVDKFYTLRLAFNVIVMGTAAIWLLMDPIGIARTLSNSPEEIDRISSYLYFRGWFMSGLLFIGFYAYFKNWYPTILFCCSLLLGAMNLVSDLFTIYPDQLAKPSAGFTLILMVRLALLWVMFMSIKNASRMPDLRDRINPFLFLNRGTVRP